MHKATKVYRIYKIKNGLLIEPNEPYYGGKTTTIFDDCDTEQKCLEQIENKA